MYNEQTRTTCHRMPKTCNSQQCSRLGVPTASEVRVCLGPSLAQVFFQYSHDDTKNLLDLIAPEKSPPPCFTVQIDKNRLASLAHDDTVKANVHDAILEIGETLLERFRRQIEDELRNEIEKQSQEKFHMYQAKKRREAELKSQELHEKYRNYIKTVQQEIQKQIEIEWGKASAEWVKRMQKAVVQERMKVTDEIMQKMRTEMAYAIQLLYQEFEESFRADKETIIADFNGITRATHVKLDKEKREFEEKVGRELHVQRHQYEMQNTVNVINIHCLEQLRCCREKHIIHEHFERQIKGLRVLVARLNDVITAMREEIINCHVEKKSLEEQFCEVAKQFQKFINFAFSAVPEQAQYLLPLELQRLIVSDKNGTDENSQKKF
ncbi:uncharacterized protein LOC143215632 [Lasioglossum baleicum]|uniref:uncharacterized protein LOC143215632 n=1 Tax=Lasioglossum baleicum TaxID=434251 RepID=UPI003FCDF93D